jgi:outer membrane protein OmpA-like peptidoglycan-associated protein
MNTRIFCTAALAATLAACSSIPDRNAALEQARSQLSTAQNDPRVAALAPDELKQASDSLRAADQAWNDHGSLAQVDHLAYIASQRVVIAKETASSKDSQSVTAGAAAERDKTRLALRTNEADMAQQQLAMSQQSNAQKNIELAANQAQVNSLETQLKDLNAKKTDRGMVVTLGDVLFDSGKSRLLPTGAHNMAKLSDFFKRNPQRKASIEGYTDSVGGASANQALSEQRAHAVMAALVNLGVPTDRLSTQAFGEASPVADNGTAAGRQLNRRVEIVFTPQPGDLSAK